MELRKFIATTIREYLNENIDILPDYINIDGEKYEPGTYHLKCLHKKIQLVY